MKYEICFRGGQYTFTEEVNGLLTKHDYHFTITGETETWYIPYRQLVYIREVR
jgi:hypothetical protein